MTWQLIKKLQHKPSLNKKEDQFIFKEVEATDHHLSAPQTNYVMMSSAIKLPQKRTPVDKANPFIGIKKQAWNYNGSYLASVDDSMPNVLWIWDILNLVTKAVLIQISPIKSFAWACDSSRLLICTGTSQIFIWQTGGASVCNIPFEG